MTTVTALPSPPSRDDPATFSSKADAFFGAMPTMVTQINTVSGEINSNASTASSAAGTASSAASTATTKAGEASASASAASASATTATTKAAEAAASAALATGFLGPLATLSASQALTVNTAYQFATSGQTYTLPAGAVNGDTIILSNTGTATNNVIARNGKTIMGVAEDMTFDFTGHTVTLKCIGSDWRIV